MQHEEHLVIRGIQCNIIYYILPGTAERVQLFEENQSPQENLRECSRSQIPEDSVHAKCIRGRSLNSNRDLNSAIK